MWYLKSAFDAYQNVQSSVKDRISQMQSVAMSPLSVVRNFLQTPPGPGEAQGDELRELRRRIAELEATPGPTKVRQPRAKPARKKAPRAKK